MECIESELLADADAGANDRVGRVLLEHACLAVDLARAVGRTRSHCLCWLTLARAGAITALRVDFRIAVKCKSAAFACIRARRLADFTCFAVGLWPLVHRHQRRLAERPSNQQVRSEDERASIA